MLEQRRHSHMKCVTSSASIMGVNQFLSHRDSPAVHLGHSLNIISYQMKMLEAKNESPFLTVPNRHDLRRESIEKVCFLFVFYSIVKINPLKR